VQASRADIDKVTYISSDALDDRVIPLQPCYLGDSKWETWAPTVNGLFQVRVLDVVDSCYFSKEPAADTDINMAFVGLIMKRAYFKDLVHFEKAIVEDVNNLTASISKINLFHEIWREDKNKISKRFITTELEYIFKVCRSLFDLLQEIISKIWARFNYLDPSLKTKNLKPTFSRMVFFDGKLSSSQEIAERYLLPDALADFYHRNGKFFSWLRSFRDKIAHGGNSIDSLYFMDDGFAVSIETEPFKGLHIWDETELKPNNLGSVRALLSYTILNTLHALEDFGELLPKVVQLPPDIAPDYHVYIRGENMEVLHKLHKYMDGDEWIKIQSDAVI